MDGVTLGSRARRTRRVEPTTPRSHGWKDPLASESPGKLEVLERPPSSGGAPAWRSRRRAQRS